MRGRGSLPRHVPLKRGPVSGLAVEPPQQLSHPLDLDLLVRLDMSCKGVDFRLEAAAGVS
jgi:hypothetical protein